ncbi:MAG: DUF4335 domain-containing protein [Coleofasciculaceae cyanobacterium SM2_1_6]|nr:DUF4335 domain-containing protein [Coleofasciculaceae cyanobacterium SM2_1_6]
MAHWTYTPPTCTLSVETTNSFLPKLPWVVPVVRALKPISPASRISFVLSFDDPRRTVESMTVKGDRSQIDRLYLAVNVYIQELLNKKGLAAKEPQGQVSLNSNPTGGRSAQPSRTQTLAPQKLSPQTLGANSTSPYLQPQGFLTHRLYLGELQTGNLTSIDLTTTQLFDLVTALDAYTNEINNVAPRNNWWKSKWFANWGLATAAMLCSVGLISLGLKLLQTHKAAEAIAPTSQTIDNRPAPADVQIFPIPRASIPPLPTTAPLGANQKLTIPNPVQVPPGGSVNIPPLAPPAIPRTVGNNQGNLGNQNNQNIPNNQTSVFPPGETPSPTLPNFGSSLRSGEPNFLPNPGQLSSQPLPLVPLSLPNLPALNPNDFQETPTPEAPPLSLESNSPEVEEKQSSPAAGALFDQIPQVPEVRKYFQSRWLPSGESSPTLEYSLVLNSDGSIARIIPLGQGAQNYLDRLDRLEFPALHTPFVTPFPNGGMAKIRLVLNADGRVQTFLESL